MADEMETIRQAYLQRDLAARDWKRRGGKVVGYICNTVPEELIWAAGMMPVRLTGTPGGSVGEITKWFNVNRYTEGFVNTMLDDVVTGQYDYLDYLVLPHATRTTLQTQHAHLHILRQLFPDTTKVPELYFLEQTQSWAHTGVEYTCETYRAFKKQLEVWAEGDISPRRLQEAIDQCNHMRDLMTQLAQLRDAQKISGVEAMEIYGASYRMDRDEFNRLLEIVLRDAHKRDPIPGKRVFLEGSPQDNLGFYRLVESCGGVVVNEDNCWGSRSFEDKVDTRRFPDLLEALAQRYHYKAPCGYVYFPAGARCDYCKGKVAQVDCDGVIFYILENDAHGLWDFVDQRDAFHAQGRKTLELLEQPYDMANKEALRSTVSAFLAEL